MAATQGTLVDKRDGKKYRTVKIGDQTWMAENLNYKIKDSYCYQYDESSCSKYGRLYTLGAAKEACPSGWHLPSKAEFETLFSSVGGEQVAGKNLKSKNGWNKGGNGTDAFGFSALPAGSRLFNGDYHFVGNYAYFWSSTERDSDYAYYMHLDYSYVKAYLNFDDKEAYAFSVRCLQDDNGLAESVVDVPKNVFENSTAEILVDKRDGKKYKTVKIGNQTWMAENLNYKTGDSYCYKDKEANCTKYGRLYSWDAALKACPAGWHLPSNAEFETLFSSVGGKNFADKSLKSKKGWKDNGNGTDAFGFSALPAGYRDFDGGYDGEGYGVDVWCSSESNRGGMFAVELLYDVDYARFTGANMNVAFSVRCLKDDNGSAESAVEEPKNMDVENSSAGTLVDKRDGKKYKMVKIDNQTWMAENLNYKTQDSYCYEDKNSNCSKYGRLYTWNAAKEACPSGWHLPSNAEFETLFSSVGGKQVAGKGLKFKKGWNKSGNGADILGFSALPAGYRGREGGSYDGILLDYDYNDGYYDYEGDYAYFWSSTEYDSGVASSMYLGNSNNSAGLNYNTKIYAFSVRCLKN